MSDSLTEAVNHIIFVSRATRSSRGPRLRRWISLDGCAKPWAFTSPAHPLIALNERWFASVATHAIFILRSTLLLSSLTGLYAYKPPSHRCALFCRFLLALPFLLRCFLRALFYNGASSVGTLSHLNEYED